MFLGSPLFPGGSGLDILLRLQHPNIVQLLCYFDDSKENGALLLEYLPQGNLQEMLHSNIKQVLSCKNRIVIVCQLVQAIEHIREKCVPQIVHGDIESSNILLNNNHDCKFCNFWSAKGCFFSMIHPPTMPSRQVKMVGSPGYTDPHYLRNGIASEKMVMYGFGVVVLQLVSGKEVLSAVKGEMLVHIAAPLINEMLDSSVDITEYKVRLFLDPKLIRALGTASRSQNQQLNSRNRGRDELNFRP